MVITPIAPASDRNRGLEVADWQKLLDATLVQMRAEGLATQLVVRKSEAHLRDIVALALRTHLSRAVRTEWRAGSESIDIVALRGNDPELWIELKTAYSFDAACSGGAILLAGKYGRTHSVASDVAKLQRSAQRAAGHHAYVVYASVHLGGALSEAARSVMVADYFAKQQSAMRRFGSAARLVTAVDEMAAGFGDSGKVGPFQAKFGRYPLRHVITHHGTIGLAFGIEVSLRTWIWEVPLA